MKIPYSFIILGIFMFGIMSQAQMVGNGTSSGTGAGTGSTSGSGAGTNTGIDTLQPGAPNGREADHSRAVINVGTGTMPVFDQKSLIDQEEKGLKPMKKKSPKKANLKQKATDPSRKSDHS